MFRIAVLLIITVFAALANSTPKKSIVYDLAHGQRVMAHVDKQHQHIAKHLNATVTNSTTPLSEKQLENTSLLYIRAPNQAFSDAEINAIVQYVRNGGSLLLVVDEERRQPLQTTQVNRLISPFSMMLTQDTPYLHNAGAIAFAGEINRQVRELAFSGGRAVVGGTPFAFQITKEGKPGLPFAAYKNIDGSGRIVVMGEGMASIFMGEDDAVRMSGEHRNPRNTKYWGKDSQIFMQEIIHWLTSR